MKDFRKATPRPWQSVKYQGSENHYHIFSQPDKSVMYQSVCSANKIDSALILAAVNNFDKMKEVLEALMTNPHINLGDKIYDVRESEGEGWEGPSVIAWGKAVSDAKQLLESLK